METDGDRDLEGLLAGRRGDLLGGEADVALLSVDALDSLSRLMDSDDVLLFRTDLTGRELEIPLELDLIRLASGERWASSSEEDDEQLEDLDELEFLTLGTIFRLDWLRITAAGCCWIFELELRLSEIAGDPAFSEMDEFLLDVIGVAIRSKGPGLTLDEALPPEELFRACRLARR